MPGHGDDAGHTSKGSSARNYREANAEERATYRKWMVGIILFYCTLLLISGVVAITIDASTTSLTRLTTLSTHPTVASSRSK